MIPNLSDKFLILDSETIFYKPVRFVDEAGRGLYCVSDEKNPYYYHHMVRLVPELRNYGFGIHPQQSGIVHHMLFDKYILNSLFNSVETHHQKPFWRAFMDLVIVGHGASEYEIYFCFAFVCHPQRVAIRHLKWDISSVILEDSPDYDYLTAHAHLRKPLNQ